MYREDIWKVLNRGRVNYLVNKRRRGAEDRTPTWADLDAIAFFYECCPADCHVDHIIPLHGKNISGLHVETNLQWLPASENLKKSNTWN